MDAQPVDPLVGLHQAAARPDAHYEHGLPVDGPPTTYHITLPAGRLSRSHATLGCGAPLWTPD